MQISLTSASKYINVPLFLKEKAAIENFKSKSYEIPQQIASLLANKPDTTNSDTAKQTWNSLFSSIKGFQVFALEYTQISKKYRELINYIQQILGKVSNNVQLQNSEWQIKQDTIIIEKSFSELLKVLEAFNLGKSLELDSYLRSIEEEINKSAYKKLKEKKKKYETQKRIVEVLTVELKGSTDIRSDYMIRILKEEIDRAEREKEAILQKSNLIDEELSKLNQQISCIENQRDVFSVQNELRKIQDNSDLEKRKKEEIEKKKSEKEKTISRFENQLKLLGEELKEEQKKIGYSKIILSNYLKSSNKTNQLLSNINNLTLFISEEKKELNEAILKIENRYNNELKNEQDQNEMMLRLEDAINNTTNKNNQNEFDNLIDLQQQLKGRKRESDDEIEKCEKTLRKLRSDLRSAERDLSYSVESQQAQQYYEENLKSQIEEMTRLEGNIKELSKELGVVSQQQTNNYRMGLKKLYETMNGYAHSFKNLLNFKNNLENETADKIWIIKTNKNKQVVIEQVTMMKLIFKTN